MPYLVEFLQHNRRTLMGVGLAVVFARKVLPQMRPLAKTAIKGFLRARDSLIAAVEKGAALMPGGE